MKRFLIACGGTGGHLTPGLAVAEALGVLGHEVLLVVSGKAVDQRLLEAYPDVQYVTSPGAAFYPGGAKVFGFLYEQVRAVFFAIRLLGRFQPDVVMGFGGFTTVGVALAGWLRGKPLVLHEANRRPGRATRLLSGLADRVYLPDGIRVRGVSVSRTCYPGLPVRKGIGRTGRVTARRSFGLEPESRVLLVLGGSQGAAALNQWVGENTDLLTQEGINVICLTGMEKGHQGTFERTSSLGEKIKVIYLPFSDEVGTLMRAADLAISRAGAGTLAELARCQLPAVLVPYPHAADDHQVENARYVERQTGAVMILEEKIGDLLGEVRDLIFNEAILDRMRTSLHRLDRPHAAEDIAEDLERVATGKRRALLRPHASLRASP